MAGTFYAEVNRLTAVALTGYEVMQLEGVDHETLRQCSELLDCLNRAEELAAKIRWA